MQTGRLQGIKVKPLKEMFSGAKKSYGPFYDRYGKLNTGSEDDQEAIEAYQEATGKTVDQSFWHKYKIMFTDEEKFIPYTAENRIAINLLKSHPKFANGPEEMDDWTKEYMIIDEEAEARKKVQSRELRKTAYALLDKLSQNEMYDFMYLYGVDVSDMSADIVKDKLFDRLEQNPKKFIRMFEDAQRKDRQFIEKAIAKKLLRRNGSAIYHGVESDTPMLLGNNMEQAIAFLKDPENQQFYINLKKELQ
jgi:hypothetical protein